MEAAFEVTFSNGLTACSARVHSMLTLVPVGRAGELSDASLPEPHRTRFLLVGGSEWGRQKVGSTCVAANSIILSAIALILRDSGSSGRWLPQLLLGLRVLFLIGVVVLLVWQ